MAQTDIADEVMQTASQVYQLVIEEFSSFRREQGVWHIANAILAERERCALIVEMHDHQDVIAAAIREASK